MTKAADLIEELKGRGVRFKVVGDRLRFHPRSAVTVEDLARLRDHKQELLVLLKLSCASFLELPTPLNKCIGRGDVVSPVRSVNINETSPIPVNSEVSLTAAPDTRSCPACGSARIAPGKRRVWCLDCERDIGPVIDSQDRPTGEAPDRIGGALAGDRWGTTDGEWLEVIDADGRRAWQRAEMLGYDVADLPTPCPVCAGIDQWEDLRGGWHCEACEPRKIGPRLRETAQRLRAQYGLADSDRAAASNRRPPELRDGGRDSADIAHGPAVPKVILRDSPMPCGDCGRAVMVGQPGRASGLCFECWFRRQVRR